MGDSASRLGPALLGLCLLTACGGGLSIERDYDPDQDFSVYTTYAWSTPRGDLSRSALIDEFTDVRVRRAIDVEMARAGFERSDPGSSDLTVGYIARVDTQVERSVNDPTTAPVDRVGGTYDRSPSDRIFEEGSLEIGLVDVRRNRVVWRGTARAEMDPAATSVEREQRIERAIQQIMKEFPPR